MNFLRTIRPLVWLVLAFALAIPHAPAAPPTAPACVREAAAENRACCKHCACEAKPATKSETPAPAPAVPARTDSAGPLAPPTETMVEIPAPELTPATGERLERASDSAAAVRDVRVPLYRRHCAFLI